MNTNTTDAQGGHPDQQPPDISVVITCYNEELFIVDTLDNVIGALHEVGCSYEVIVADDVSTDTSVQKVREYAEKHPESRVVLQVNKTNRGLANNYVDAAFLARGKYFRLCCGDNAETKEVLVPLFRQIGRANMVIPYQDQANVIGKSYFRKLLSNTFTFLVNLASGYHIRYYNGLAIHLRYNVMRWHPSSYGFGFQADMITRLLDEGVSYLQVPSVSIDRKGSSSSALTMRNVLSVGHTLLEISLRRARRTLFGRSMPKPRETMA